MYIYIYIYVLKKYELESANGGGVGVACLTYVMSRNRPMRGVSTIYDEPESPSQGPHELSAKQHQ